ncbi:casein kinase I-like [Eurosta solidaginis]|uniref:casein kinase I-like n=1 Tax=Eurosta solidaginis TaxID=178769 RepID=UPI0035309336
MNKDTKIIVRFVKVPRMKENRSEIKFAENYRIKRKIGSGSHGDIYLGICIKSGEEVAIKIERTNATHPQLLHEAKLYKILRRGVGIPRIRHHGKEKNFNFLVMDLLGPSLEDLFNSCKRHFSIKTVLMLVDQMIARLHYIHMNGIIHKSIKPENFVMGIGRDCNKLFLIDFGRSKKYWDPVSRTHIPYREENNWTTSRYASINSHLGIEQSRRDDMESLGYVMMYFNRGVLPWQRMKANNMQQKCETISEKKMSTPIKVLCEGFPEEFLMYMYYCRNLSFQQRPDYMYLRENFRILFRKLNHHHDYIYDWTMLKQETHQGLPNPAILLEQAESPNESEKEKEKQDGKPMISD